MKKILAIALIAVLTKGACFAEAVASEATKDANVIAVVLGKKITAGEKDQLNGMIFGALLEQYAKDNKIEPTKEELDVFVTRLEGFEKKLQIDKEQIQGMEEQAHATRLLIAQQFVKAWKINKTLHAKYGGRVLFQQAGIEPLEAYRDFLKEQEKKGAFQILDKQYEAGFWRYFTDDTKLLSKEDSVKAFDTPWWLMEMPQGK